jgi:hypothetical protein
MLWFLIDPDEQTEKRGYDKLDWNSLVKIDDAESMFERAQRLALEKKDPKQIKDLIVRAARKRHPVALARCFLDGIGTPIDEKRAIAILQSSADRGMQQVFAALFI